MYPIVMAAAAGFPTDWTTVVSAIWTGIGDVITTVSSNALLLIPIAGAFAGLVIGLCMKLMGIRRKRR